MICPLCKSAGVHFYEYLGKIFYKCSFCESIYLDVNDYLNEEDEKNRYLEHNNDVQDERYQNFVLPITSSVMNHYNSEHIGLDYGAGTGPVITKVLREKGYQITPYDPFFINDKSLLKQKYDYITCCEVMEHFHYPDEEFQFLFNLLNENGRLFCMTDLYYDEINFDLWYYKNDPSHVFIFSPKSIEIIADKFQFRNFSIHNRLITFSK